MADKLRIYKQALRIAGEGSIASLTEDREPRYLLDEVWDDDIIGYCLSQGQWRFATRTIQSDYDTGITPGFGYTRAHEIPSDWVITTAVSSDEYFNNPLTRYKSEQGYWYCDLDTIYVSYISDHADWGNNLLAWPKLFADYVAAAMARDYVFRLTSDKGRRGEALAWEKQAKLAAKNTDSMGDPTKFPPEGAWSRSRRTGATRERGNRNQLIG